MNFARRRYSSTIVLAALAGLVFSPSARAAELSAMLPQDTVLYVEWSGGDAVREARSATAMGKLLAEPEMKRFGAELKKGFEALKQLAKQDEQARPAVEAVLPLLEIMGDKGMALDLVGVEMTPAGPGVSAVLAVEVGDQAESFMKHIETLRSMLPIPASPKPETLGGNIFQRLDVGPLPPIRYGVIDGVFLLAMGGDIVDRVLAAKSGAAPNLSKNEALAAARRRLNSNASNTQLTLHLDLVRLQAEARKLFTAMTGATEFPPLVVTLLEELGVNGMTALTYTGQFKDNAYAHAGLLATRGPAKGLLKLLEAKPLADEDFHAVPADASFAQVSNFDLQAAYDEGMRIVRQVGGPALQAVNDALAEFEKTTELKLREDIIEVFDDGWAFFDAPSNGGLWIGGLTLVIEAKDGKAFMAMLDKVAARIRSAVGEKNLTPLKGDVIHQAVITAGPIPVSPSWGVQGDRVVIALFPQMVQQTLERMAAPNAKERCILANPDFVRGRKLLPVACSSVTYVNTKQGASDLYTFALPAATAAASYACSQGVPINPAAFPTRETVVRHLFGDVSGISRCEEGILLTGHGPLPMSIPSTFGGQQSVATSAVMISILLPSLSRARELSQRVVSQSNLNAIGHGCVIYAGEHDGEFPPSIQVLVEANLLTARPLISPRDPSPDDCSYEYIAGQNTESDLRNVLAYEPDFDAKHQMAEEDISRLEALGYLNTSGSSGQAPPDVGRATQGEGGNILFVDMHVEWVKPPRYQQLIDETRERLGKTPTVKTGRSEKDN